MILHIVGGVFLVGLVVAAYVQIPAEDPEIIKARKEYGKAK